MNDHERIFLQPDCCADPDTGRLWCEDPSPEDCDQGAPWTEYVRRDIFEERERYILKLECALRQAAEEPNIDRAREIADGILESNVGAVLERENAEFFDRWHDERRKREALANDVERCYRMLLSEPDTKGALFKAENILRDALAGANAKTHNPTMQRFIRCHELLWKHLERDMKAKPLDELEMFELLQAAYPEKFPDDEDETFEAAQQFAEEIQGWEAVADLLGRVAMLTMPMEGGLTKRLSHCLGRVTLHDGQARMIAAVRRDAFEEPSHDNQ